MPPLTPDPTGGNGWTRRTALRRAVAGAAGIVLADFIGLPRALASPQEAPAPPSSPQRGGRARSVIEIWMWGGPCHIDTFDPKPEAGRDYCGPLTDTLETNVRGIRIGSSLPELAKCADLYSLVRSVTHGNNGHETAAYIVQTGREPGGRLVYPGFGSVVSLFKGYDAGYSGLIPPYIVLTQPKGRFSETGFLGPRYRSFVTGGDPNRPRFAVEGIVSEGITDERQRSRRDLLEDLDTLGRSMPEDGLVGDMERCREKAYDLILGESGKLFDLSTEENALRDRYGRSTFGQSCLMARRLVEYGVPYVTINYGGWDSHKQHFETMRRKLPEFDRGLASLLHDLRDRGLLETTIVWCTGEFGRTPKVQWEPPWNGGRSHFGRVFSSLLAGGGFQGGRVLGSSSATGEEPKDDPVHPREILASMYRLLDIDPLGPMPNVRNLPVKVIDPPEGGELGTAMKEISPLG